MTKIDIALMKVLVASRRLAELQSAIKFAQTNTCVATPSEIRTLISECDLVRAELESRMKEYDNAIRDSERKNG